MWIHLGYFIGPHIRVEEIQWFLIFHRPPTPVDQWLCGFDEYQKFGQSMCGELRLKKTIFYLQLFIDLVPSHINSPNFWNFILQTRTVLYRIRMVSDQQGSGEPWNPNKNKEKKRVSVLNPTKSQVLKLNCYIWWKKNLWHQFSPVSSTNQKVVSHVIYHVDQIRIV